MKKLKILFLESQPCIRALKYAIGLKKLLKRNVEIYFGYLKKTLTQFYGSGDEYFKGFFKLNKRNLKKSCKDLETRYNS